MQILRERWAEAILALLGALALAALIAQPFRFRAGPDNGDLQTDLDSGLSLEPPHESDRPSQTAPLPCSPASHKVSALLKGVGRGRTSVGKTVTELAALGPAAVPAILTSMEDRNPAVRLTATLTLDSLAPQARSQAGVIVPAVTRRLRDPRGDIRFAATITLLHLGPTQLAALPGLLAAARDTNGLSKTDLVCLHRGVAYLLGSIGPEAAPAIPLLNQILYDDASLARDTAAIALWRITCDTELVVPQLRSMLQETNPHARFQSAAALERIGRETILTPEAKAEVEAAKALPDPDKLYYSPAMTRSRR